MKILVIHATAGAGHKKAAEAIFNGLTAAGHNAHLVDALDYTNPFFKATYPKTYELLVTKLSWAWKFFFGILDIPAIQPLVKIVRRIYNGFNAGALQNFLIKENFDVIITTQFLSAEVSAYLKRSGKITSKVICVVTDFDVHRIWINEGIDIYVGASDFTKDKLIKLGIPANRAFVTGIPTDAKFTAPVDTAALKVKLGLKDGMFTVLVATGSFGMGPIEELIDRLKNYQLVIVCGHNKHLYERLKPTATATTHVFGLVHNMHELMSVCDAMVTKPGGLSIAEALVKHLPMIFFSAIPGQETQNIMVLKKYGAGMDQMSVTDIAATIDGWNKSPETFAQVRANMNNLAKPDAVKDIIKIAETSL
jgi:processive 1,2-diacylglycerol beta-glucosyltransferase